MWQPRLADPTPWGWALLFAQVAALAIAVLAGKRQGWRAWAWPCALLALLIADRLVDLGLLAYLSGSRALRTLGVYGGRRPWQIGGSIALASAVVAVAIAAVRSGSGRLGAAWWAVVASGLAMVAIQAIRITSLHEIDAWMGMVLPFPGGPRLFQALPTAPIAAALVGAVAGAFGKAPPRPRPTIRPAERPTPGPHWTIRLAVLLLVLTLPEWVGQIFRRVGLEPAATSAVREDGR